MIRTIRNTCTMGALGAVTVIAGLAGTSPPAHAATLAQLSWIKASSYKFASNPGGLPLNGSGLPVVGWWRVSNSPFSYATSSQSLARNGVDLSITPSTSGGDQGWASSGVVVPLGTVASSGLLNTGPGGGLNPLPYSGSSNLQASIFFDTNGDGHYFDFNGGVLAGYGTPPDQIATNAAGGVSASALQNDENPGLGNRTHIWAWINLVSGSVGQNTTGNVYSVNGHRLTKRA